MIVATSYVRSLNVDRVLEFCPQYTPIEPYETINSWSLTLPSLVLMEGFKIKPHVDGWYYQALIILKNDESQWTIRGQSQKVRQLEPQSPGTILILDTSKSHLVSGNSQTPWLTLCYNPNRTLHAKDDNQPEQLILKLKEAIERLR
jgi:hypothetical protein